MDRSLQNFRLQKYNIFFNLQALFYKTLKF